MQPILAAKVWHYWLAIPLVAVGVLATISLVIGYLAKVTAHRPPRQ